MSNSNRSPKDLKELIEKSKKETDAVDIEQALVNLRNIPNEEKTEMGLLRSRIEEQSRLIMILKQRGDEYIRKNQVLEKQNKDLFEKIESYNTDVKELEKKCDLLNNRFNDLAENHEELIKIKDDYKKNNGVLKDDNQRLKLELFKYKSVDDLRNGEYLTQINQLKETCKMHESIIDELKESIEKKRDYFEGKIQEKDDEINFKTSQFDSKVNDYEIKVGNLNRIIQNYENEMKNFSSKHESKLLEISKERDELLDLTVHRGKLIQVNFSLLNFSLNLNFHFKHKGKTT
jgi:hypothetical protein